jgi:hypothetical protein
MKEEQRDYTEEYPPHIRLHDHVSSFGVRHWCYPCAPILSLPLIDKIIQYDIVKRDLKNKFTHVKKPIEIPLFCFVWKQQHVKDEN